MHLRQILVGIAGAGSPGPERLDRAALDLASIHEPELDPEPSLLRLNELASSLGDRLRNFNDGRDFVEKAESYLFGEVGFKGNLTEYFDPRNSCLNHVIERQTGLPIALCVLYMEISRRLQMPVFGIDLPRHFIVKFDDGRYLPIQYTYDRTGIVTGVQGSLSDCVDCRERGGTTVKPSFWQ